MKKYCLIAFILKLHLQLLLGQTVLEVRQEGSNTIFTVIQQGNHTFRVHGFTNIEFIVLKIFKNLLDKGLRSLLEGTHTVRIAFLQTLRNFLHVSLDVCHERLLVKRCFLQTERVNDIVDLDHALLERFVLAT